MKRFLKPKYLPFAVLFLGMIAYVLRTLLWASAIGAAEDRLLPAGSWPDITSWIMIPVTFVLAGFGVWHLRGGNKYRDNFPPSLFAAIGMAVAAVSFATCSIMELSAQAQLAGGKDTLVIVSSILGLAATACMLLLAYGRMTGRQFNMLPHGAVCLYLMFFLISHYQLWSAAPQLQTYAFELLAIVFVMLACYHRAAFDAEKGDRRKYTFFSMAALFLCIAAIPGSDNVIFYIGCAVWMLCTPCKMAILVPEED